jgi:hypothetical protein
MHRPPDNLGSLLSQVSKASPGGPFFPPSNANSNRDNSSVQFAIYSLHPSCRGDASNSLAAGETLLA